MTTFESRHGDSDKQLPAARKELLERALEDLSGDPDVIAVYLTGTLAKGGHDPYSDIDLHIAVRVGTKARFVRQKRERPARWGEVLSYEDVAPRRPVVVAHFASFVKVDTWYHELEEIKPSIWFAGSKALYDPDGLLADVFMESDQIEYRPTAQEVEM